MADEQVKKMYGKMTKNFEYKILLEQQESIVGIVGKFILCYNLKENNICITFILLKLFNKIIF